MKKNIIVVLLIFYSLAGIVPLVAKSAKYDFIINRENSTVPLLRDKLEAELKNFSEDANTTESRLRNAFLLFEFTLFESSKENTEKSFAYMEKILKEDPRLQNNLVMQAYLGTAKTLMAKPLSNPIRKITLLDEGMGLIDKSIAQLKKNDADDFYAIGFVYFLRASVLKDVPSFLPISEEAEETFANSLSYFKKAKLSKEDGDIVSRLFLTHSNYYKGRGKIRRAKQEFARALKFAYSDEQKQAVKQEAF